MAKKYLLVLEPDDHIRNMLEIYFTGQGYKVFTLADAVWAWEFSLQQPDVIILNKQIDHEVDLARRLRTNDLTGYIPIIFLSRKDERSDRLTSLELGADNYVTIPFDIEELKLRIENAIKWSKQNPSS